MFFWISDFCKCFVLTNEIGYFPYFVTIYFSFKPQKNPCLSEILMAGTENEDKRMQCLFSHNPETGEHTMKLPGTKFKMTLHNKLSNSLTQ